MKGNFKIRTLRLLNLKRYYVSSLNADKTKYMVVSRGQRTGRNHSVKIDSNSFEGVEEF